MSGRNSQVARIYRVLSLLESAPNGLTVKQLHARLQDLDHDAGERTVRRDLEALEAAGFPLSTNQSTDEGSQVWTLADKARVTSYLVLNSRELLALYIMREALAPLADTPFYADLQTAFSKFEEKIGDRGREHLSELSNEIRFDPLPRWGLGLDPDLLETVRACCSERQILEVTYNSVSSGKKQRRTLGPHYMYFAQGSLYLVAEDMEASALKVFALPRMSEAVMTAQSYEREPVDPAEFFKSSFGVFRGDQPVAVKVEFGPLVAQFVRERKWHQSQRVVNIESGKVQIAMDVAVTPELVQWVLGFGANARVVEPEALRKQVIQAAEATLRTYSRKAA